MRAEGALLEVSSPRPCVLEATSVMSGATPGILQDRSLTGRCLTDTPRLPEAFGHMIPSMFCSTGYSPIWCKIAASSDEVKLDVSRHSSFVQSHRAVFKLRWDGWVDGSFRTSPLCAGWVSRLLHSQSALDLSCRCRVTLHFLPLEAHPWSDPR